MPKKEHRAALRQAQVRRRRRRGKGAPQALDSGPVERPSVAAVDELSVTVTPEPVIKDRPLEPAPQPVRRTRQRASAASEPVPGYAYLGAELRQIGMITTLIVVILAVLAVFLRN